jgi:hypothetical protein
MVLIYREKTMANASDASSMAGIVINARENKVYVDVS